jgi:hypothetical protein
MNSTIQNTPMHSNNQAVPPVINKPPKINVPNRKKWKWLAILIVVVGVFIVLAASLLVGTATHGGLGRRDPRRVTLQALTKFKFPSQLSQAEPLCTAEGFITLQGMATGGNFLKTFTMGQIKSNPGLCDIQLVRDTVEGRTIIWVRMVDDNGWKFQDIYLEQTNGRPIKYWASYALQNPFTTFMGINSGEIADGLHNTAERIKEFVDVINALKSLDDRDRKK